ncbi:MAG: MoaD/ThiS family protein [Patescibacteria group bacterium]|nr:MoaD/ThiS family protein [Patescibacteria group bacterium]
MESVTCGVNSLESLVAGKTIAELRQSLSTALNIAPDAASYVNGEIVPSDYVVRSGDSVEFIKAAGVKG